MPEAMPPYAYANLGPIAGRVESALTDLDAQAVLARMRRPDHTVWSDDPTEITEPNRLGWLEVAADMARETGALRDFAASVAADGYTKAVLLGMGGSSLAPEVLQNTFGSAPDRLGLYVLDTTHPDAILDLRDTLELDKTLFIVASKSGSTIETMSQFRYFWDLIPDGAHFIAITDPGSGLQKLGEAHGFRRVFLNRPDIGGRYSALSYFGLVPAALIGADLDALLAQAAAMSAACEAPTAGQNPGAWFGAVMGEAALAGRDKLTLFLPPKIASFGDWVEQLLAESTGKEGKGIIPIVGEPAGLPQAYGPDRLFVAIGESTDLPGLEAAGHPVLRLPYHGPEQLGAEFLRWEFATAIAGQRLHINPFDQPNVQSAKDATSRILDEGVTRAPATPSIADVLSSVTSGDYICVLAYLPRNHVLQRELEALRLDLRDRYLVPTMLGFGPRYLHSTGQLHKGGPNSGVFILITDDANRDAPVPGAPYTFDRLRTAQALGDLQSLLAAGRRVAHVHIDGDRVYALQALARGLA
jgi:glucose-6-phosphate isomerase